LKKSNEKTPYRHIYALFDRRSQTKILMRFKDEKRRVRGRADIDVSWKVDRSKPYTILARTNAALFGELAGVGAGNPCL